MFLKDQERKLRIADDVYAANLGMHGDQGAFEMFHNRMRRDL